MKAIPKYNLENKTVLITGATRGIGHGILQAFGTAGANVIGTATTEAGAEKITAAIAAANFKGFGALLDVRNKSAMVEMIDTIKSQFGPIAILVNNAAIAEDNLILRMKDEQWDQVIDTDLSGVFRLIRLTLRDMLKAHWGRVINIGSVVGNTGNPGQANYCAAKAGLLGLTKSVALEVGSRNITVNTVAPGFIETDMTNILNDEQRASIFNRIPMNRVGQAEDVAACVLFLASDGASYITGQTLHVNGGMYMP